MPCATLLAGLALVACHGSGNHTRSQTTSPPASGRASAEVETPGAAPPVTAEAAESARPLRVPSGDPPHLTCRDARAIVAEVRRRLPSEPPAVRPAVFAELWADWFDPHGLWSAAPDAPLAAAARVRARALLAELEDPNLEAPCAAALELGGEAKRWVDGLRGVFEERRSEARAVPFARALAEISEPAFEEDSVSRPAREFASDLGRRIGEFSKAAPALAEAPASAALSRFFPDASAERWAEVVLAAAVRAYVPAIDPHGEWAPLEEEWALFSGDPIDDSEPSLWTSARRTALGTRIVSEPRAPLEVDDLVLAVDGVQTAGLGVEQGEQLARVDAPGGKSLRAVRVLRAGSATPLDLDVGLPADGADSPEPLRVARVRYGSGSVLVVPIAEVGDHLGEDLADVLADARERQEPLGVVLDLRGNGGGSTDGAAAAIGLFLPGVASFPLLHRGLVTEVMRAPAPESDLAWKGPVAVLVDGYTASAAEMIAGAIDSYGRGPLLGAHTFGKGCVQEYFDDHSGQGVLRLTTLLVALPDGTPLQHRGLEPEWLLGFPAADEHEADLEGSPGGVPGPDVRNHAAMGGAPWPVAHGGVGPCEDAVVCRALGRLGTGIPVRRGRAQNPGVSLARRAPRSRPVLSDAEHSAHGFTQSREGRGTSP